MTRFLVATASVHVPAAADGLVVAGHDDIAALARTTVGGVAG